MVMRARANVYHLECFACQQCGHRFCVGDHFYLHDNQVPIIIRWIGFDQFSNSTKPMPGAVRPRLRGADGVCLSLLPPNSTCSTQARVWRNPASAPPTPTLPQPKWPLHPAPSLLPCFFLTSSATTHPLATHIISAVFPAANLAMIESK